jgi:hypothetical protein
MEYITTAISWVKANKKKTIIGLVVILVVLNLLGVIGGSGCEEAACESGACNHGLGS